MQRTLTLIVNATYLLIAGTAAVMYIILTNGE